MNADDADNPLSRMMANCDFVAIDGLSSIRSTLSAHIRVICVIRGEIDQRRCGAEVSIAQSRLKYGKSYPVAGLIISISKMRHRVAIDQKPQTSG